MEKVVRFDARRAVNQRLTLLDDRRIVVVLFVAGNTGFGSAVPRNRVFDLQVQFAERACIERELDLVGPRGQFRRVRLDGNDGPQRKRQRMLGVDLTGSEGAAVAEVEANMVQRQRVAVDRDTANAYHLRIAQSVLERKPRAGARVFEATQGI